MNADILPFHVPFGQHETDVKNNFQKFHVGNDPLVLSRRLVCPRESRAGRRQTYTNRSAGNNDARSGRLDSRPLLCLPFERLPVFRQKAAVVYHIPLEHTSRKMVIRKNQRECDSGVKTTRRDALQTGHPLREQPSRGEIPGVCVFIVREVLRHRRSPQSIHCRIAADQVLRHTPAQDGHSDLCEP